MDYSKLWPWMYRILYTIIYYHCACTKSARVIKHSGDSKAGMWDVPNMPKQKACRICVHAADDIDPAACESSSKIHFPVCMVMTFICLFWTYIFFQKYINFKKAKNKNTHVSSRFVFQDVCLFVHFLSYRLFYIFVFIYKIRPLITFQGTRKLRCKSLKTIYAHCIFKQPYYKFYFNLFVILPPPFYLFLFSHDVVLFLGDGVPGRKYL